jgi:anti-sigma regulatory factor (Ser/Thr protein kinase)
MSDLITTLPGGPSSPHLARTALAERFEEGIDAECADTLKLLSSEVVTNCVKHAGAATGVPIELRAWMLSGCIHVEVSTAARPFHHIAQRPSGEEGGGNGLLLVSELSRSWGVVDNGRNTVWFKVGVSGESRQAGGVPA